jgi:predicted O-methyltransferase YrrM
MNKLFQIKTYLNFYIKSTNQHGVHSPFVYNLITKCFYKKTTQTKISLIDSYRNKLFSNNSKINVTDFGKGSTVFNTNSREISRIARIAGISKKRSQLLIRIVAYFSSKQILELGTSLGIGTASMSIGNPNSNITSIEGCSETARIAQEQFDLHSLTNINLQIGDLNTILPKIVINQSYDLIYFDGNHQKEATINYLNECLKHSHNDSVFIFDDIHWSKEMEQAWEIIKESPNVTVTIDTFYWGFVFFRKEQRKEHFIIRV